MLSLPRVTRYFERHFPPSGLSLLQNLNNKECLAVLRTDRKSSRSSYRLVHLRLCHEFEGGGGDVVHG
jgi:hypothetical protein